ncbi:hypothetical protein J6590_063381 [Homalodisca vitripennis]|nr:hypothetical protein J6590_007802 [Homalodisca vitripennis]KAG8286284.1 hypothetical protein J6590_063381 [Homalodisca vitripennis]
MAYSVDNDALPQASHYQLERLPFLAPPHRSYALIEIFIINNLEGAIYCKWGLPRGFGLIRGNYGANKELHHKVKEYKKEKASLMDSYFKRSGWNDPARVLDRRRIPLKQAPYNGKLSLHEHRIDI